MQPSLGGTKLIRTYLSNLHSKVRAFVPPLPFALPAQKLIVVPVGLKPLVLSSTVWECIAKACKSIIVTSGIPKSSIKGIGFDATCSLAVTNSQGSPVSVSLHSGGDYVRDIILWADHRADTEAALINSTKSSVLDYVGGTMSLEMEIPKILWLKNNMPASLFDECIFFDLPDWLTYRATGGDASRSVCSLGCKCSYVPTAATGDRGKEGWNKQFFESIGLEQFVSTHSLCYRTSDVESVLIPLTLDDER